jgi:hypothetical protein
LVFSPSRRVVPRSRQFAAWHDIEASKHAFGTAGTGYGGRGLGTHDRVSPEKARLGLVAKNENEKEGRVRTEHPSQPGWNAIAYKKPLSDNVHSESPK